MAVSSSEFPLGLFLVMMLSAPKNRGAWMAAPTSLLAIFCKPILIELIMGLSAIKNYPKKWMMMLSIN
jgi:hypothetical protein